MSYYDHIAKQWHKATGYEGGAFKRLVLNDRILQRIPDIDNHAILELGAGNGYFLPLMLRRFSGQIPTSVMVTDVSARLLEVAQRHFRISSAEYQVLDVGNQFPFESNRFDLILATMVFNEVPSHVFKNALNECYRILSNEGCLLMTVLHPVFVNSLQKRGLLVGGPGVRHTMPGADNLRLPIVVRSHDSYRNSLVEAGFQFEEEEVYPTPEVINIKTGLRYAGKGPLALIFHCKKISKCQTMIAMPGSQNEKC